MENVLLLINALYGITQIAAEFSVMINSISTTLDKARKEGRDVTDEEVQQVISSRIASQRKLADLLK